MLNLKLKNSQWICIAGNVPKSTKHAILAFPLVLIPYYSYCRHKRTTDKFKVQKIRSRLQDYANTQGLELDPEEIRRAALESGLDPEPFVEEYRKKKEALENTSEAWYIFSGICQ